MALITHQIYRRG